MPRARRSQVGLYFGGESNCTRRVLAISFFAAEMRIFLADNHDILRRGLRHLLEENPRWRVCGEANNGEDAVDRVLELKPDLVILDYDLPSMNGVAVLRLVKEALPETELLFLTTRAEDAVIAEALAAGARGYLLKSDPEEKVIDAIEALGKDVPFFGARASEMLLNHLLAKDATAGETQPLTDRELEILRLLAEGKTNREVGTALNISVKTVETHRSGIMQKLRFKSITDLVRYAIRNKLIEP